MNEQIEVKSLDSERAGIERALRRAYQRARDEAIRTHTGLIVQIAGKMVRLDPSTENPSIENEWSVSGN